MKDKNLEKNINFMRKPSIGKILFNILIVSLTILVLGFVINFYYAVGYLLILIIHELGHYIAAKFLKIEVAFGGFTPFGAYIVHGDTESCKENAFIAIAGPLFGLGLAFMYYLIYCFTGSNTFFVLSFTSILLNLFNLVPVKPLDGGHVAETISPIICYIGLPFLAYMVIISRKKVISLIISAIGTYQTYDLRKRYYKDAYFKIDRKTKIRFIAGYSILVVLFGISAVYFYRLNNINELIKSISRFK